MNIKIITSLIFVINVFGAPLVSNKLQSLETCTLALKSESNIFLRWFLQRKNNPNEKKSFSYELKNFNKYQNITHDVTEINDTVNVYINEELVKNFENVIVSSITISIKTEGNETVWKLLKDTDSCNVKCPNNNCVNVTELKEEEASTKFSNSNSGTLQSSGIIYWTFLFPALKLMWI